MGIETLSLLPKITPRTYVVLEIGIWMLEGLHTIRRSPHLAIFTNLLPDHLDAFESMEEYGAAKTSIYRYQGPDDIALFNADNDYTCRYGREAHGSNVWYFSPSQRSAFERDHHLFGGHFATRTRLHCAARITWRTCRRPHWPRSCSDSARAPFARPLRSSNRCLIGWKWCERWMA